LFAGFGRLFFCLFAYVSFARFVRWLMHSLLRWSVGACALFARRALSHPPPARARCTPGGTLYGARCPLGLVSRFRVRSFVCLFSHRRAALLRDPPHDAPVAEQIRPRHRCSAPLPLLLSTPAPTP
jgi:hypothetical protein